MWKYVVGIALAFSFLGVGFADACRFGDNTIIARSHGLPVYQGLMTMRGQNTGRRLPAYRGFNAASIHSCVQQCQQDQNCRGITYRTGRNNCLMFGQVDFETGEVLAARIIPDWELQRSVLVRARNGRRCRG